MEVEILEFEAGARKATGLTVIIDVFRAFSVECYAFDAGAEKIIATGDVEKAFHLKNYYADSVLVGEREEKKIPGFDFGNSPSEIIKADLRGNTIIHTTTAGTAGLVNAVNASIVITGSLVNASAVTAYIKSLNPQHVSLVAMGYRAKLSAEEDLLCAEVVSAALTGKKLIPESMIADLKNSSGSRFFIPANHSFSPPEDFYLCTALNKFNFIIEAFPIEGGDVLLKKVDVAVL